MAVTTAVAGSMAVALTMGRIVVVVPWPPVRMMPLDPSGIIFVPPVAVVPMMMVVPVAVAAAPLRIMLAPLGMMLPHPSGRVRMPPVRVMPFVMMAVSAPSVMLVGARRAHRHRPEHGQAHDDGKNHS